MMNVDKAYLFGLIIGGGKFGKSTKSFVIKLPFSKWGSIEGDPKRASEISKDLTQMLFPLLKNTYSLNASYESQDGCWNVLAEGDLASLKSDLESYGIRLTSDVRKDAKIGKLCKSLDSTALKKRFIAGLADTIGSTASSHRRFTQDFQTISFEFSGFNYDLVFNLCQLLASIGCYADQILWNHPNMHSTYDPFYEKWKKGFKLRVILDAYTKDLGFSFRSKALSAQENIEKEKRNDKKPVCCSKKSINPTRSTVHPGEGCKSLPDKIKNGHYVHHKHFCAVLGCPFAPKKELEKVLKNIGEYICPFPILYKGNEEDVRNILEKDDFLNSRTFNSAELNVCNLVKSFDGKELFKGNEKTTGYPIAIILDAINYLIQKRTCTLKGKRTKGNRDEVIEKYLQENPTFELRIKTPDLLSVLIIEDPKNGGACIIGAQNPTVYEKLVTRDSVCSYKISVRKIKESDF